MTITVDAPALEATEASEVPAGEVPKAAEEVAPTEAVEVNGESFPLVKIDPDDLVVDPCNVREEDGDPQVPAKLQASVERIGVQTAISVRPLDDGRYGVFAGQLRMLAAQRAKAKAKAEGREYHLVPAILRADLVGQDAKVRLLSWIENDQRADMSASDQVKALAQIELDLVGMDKAEQEAAAQTLGIERKRIAAARKAEKLKREDLDRAVSSGFDLLQLADLQEVEDMPGAIGELERARNDDLRAGTGGRGRWEHAMSRLRQERDNAKRRAEAEQELTEAGITVLPPARRPRYGEPAPKERPLAVLLNTLGKPIDPEIHQKHCPGHAARVHSETFEPVWMCTDPVANNHQVPKEPGETGGKRSPEQIAANKRTKDYNKAWRAARPVREAFIVKMVKGKINEETWEMVLQTIINLPNYYGRFTRNHSSGTTAKFLGIPDPSDDGATTTYGRGNRFPFREVIQRGARTRRGNLLLAHVAAAQEKNMHDRAWDSPDQEVKDWLTFLESQGYTLSDIEQEVKDHQRKPWTPSDSEDEDGDEDGDNGAQDEDEEDEEDEEE